jgi:hypothetical protein
LEEALQLERQLHIALLADKLSKQDEVKQQQQQDEEEEGQEKQADKDADIDAAAADSLAIPGVPSWCMLYENLFACCNRSSGHHCMAVFSCDFPAKAGGKTRRK